LTPAASPPLAQPELSDQQVWDLKARAVEEVAGTILHEFSAIVGALRVKAPSEIRDFSASGTAKLLDQLSELIEAVRNLKKAAAVANLTQFDLAGLVAEAIDAVEGRGAFEFSVAGERPFLVKADRHTLRLALLNGIRNAVESLQQFTRVDPGTIVVNWGRAGVEDWLVIVDSGAGFQGDPSAALGLGITNKRDHIGYGLATAQYAMRSMGGDVLLANDLSGGARFELRWYSNNEDTVR
jgi:C4-dicarboxylate-specific signal transduction histidine kinase